jgi:sRNA-binding protein
LDTASFSTPAIHHWSSSSFAFSCVLQGQHGVDTSLYGQGTARTTAELFEEVRSVIQQQQQKHQQKQEQQQQQQQQQQRPATPAAPT